MNSPIRPHPTHVPTLTEVIEFNPEGERLVQVSAPAPFMPAPVPDPEPMGESPLLSPDVEFVPQTEVMPVPSAMVSLASIPVIAPVASTFEPEVSEPQLSQKILTDVQRQIDSMLEFRLRESMQPLLAQFTETLMQDLRDELSRTMRDVVTRAVAQEVAKLRNNNQR